MAADDIRRLGSDLAEAAGANAADVIAKADALAAAAGPAWLDAWNAWKASRESVDDLERYLTKGLPSLPGLEVLARRVVWDDANELAEGLSGSLEIGPLKLSLASGSLVVSPPPEAGLGPQVIGPLRPDRIAATLSPPFGAGAGALPGGGAIVRLAGGAGFGGTLQVPLGPLAIDAAAILEREASGAATFLAVLGIGFTPPIQLSFGFSLDRVGGIVGVNRTVDTQALADAVRSGKAGDALFAARPPASPGAVIDDLRHMFPARAGHFVIGPTAKLSWLSFGSEGSFVSLDLGVAVEVPNGTVAIVGVAQMQIPKLPEILHLRLDVIGIIDTHDRTASIDASLVDSHVLSIFEVHGDGALRLNYGSQGYMVVSVGGFYPGFDPAPARLPALRRIGMSPDFPVPIPGLSLSAEGYFAFTTNTIQLGGRLDARFGAGITAHGFISVDALVQFRPFFFKAEIAAGFEVRVFGMTFAGVRLDGAISGPNPFTIRGKVTIETFLHDFSWDKTFTIGSGPSDTASGIGLLAALEQELRNRANLRVANDRDASVVLKPRATAAGVVALPPIGALLWAQRRAPLNLKLDRVDGQPLATSAGAKLIDVASAVRDQFAPGTFCNLTQAEALHRPTFDIKDSGGLLKTPAAVAPPAKQDDRTVRLHVILGADPMQIFDEAVPRIDLTNVAGIVHASRRPPELSNAAALVNAQRENWSVVGPGLAATTFDSATAAYQSARDTPGAIAVAELDASRPVDLAGV